MISISRDILTTNYNRWNYIVIVTGEKEQYEQRKEEVQKNGEIVARVQQELDKSGQNPEPHVRTMLDIPAKNLHK